MTPARTLQAGCAGHRARAAGLSGVRRPLASLGPISPFSGMRENGPASMARFDADVGRGRRGVTAHASAPSACSSISSDAPHCSGGQDHDKRIGSDRYSRPHFRGDIGRQGRQPDRTTPSAKKPYERRARGARPPTCSQPSFLPRRLRRMMPRRQGRIVTLGSSRLQGPPTARSTRLGSRHDALYPCLLIPAPAPTTSRLTASRPATPAPARHGHAHS